MRQLLQVPSPHFFGHSEFGTRTLFYHVVALLPHLVRISGNFPVIWWFSTWIRGPCAAGFEVFYSLLKYKQMSASIFLLVLCHYCISLYLNLFVYKRA